MSDFLDLLVEGLFGLLIENLLLFASPNNLLNDLHIAIWVTLNE